MSERIQLADYVERVGQSEAARQLDCTQPAIRKALVAGRNIYVTVHADGTAEAEELKPFPGLQKTDAA